MICPDCGTGQYVGETCLSCNGPQDQQIVEQKPTMLVIQSEFSKGTKVWVLNPEELNVYDFDWVKAKFHRDNDLPAIEFASGSKQWWINGKLHRDNDLPAIEFSNGTKKWYISDKLHRNNDLPAIERSSGTKEWWVNGKFIKRGK